MARVLPFPHVTDAALLRAILDEVIVIRATQEAILARLAPQRRDVSALLGAIRELAPAGVLFTARDVFKASLLDTAIGLRLRAELRAARILSPKQLGKALAEAGVTRVDVVREGIVWRL